MLRSCKNAVFSFHISAESTVAECFTFRRMNCRQKESQRAALYTYVHTVPASDQDLGTVPCGSSRPVFSMLSLLADVFTVQSIITMLIVI